MRTSTDRRRDRQLPGHSSNGRAAGALTMLFWLFGSSVLRCQAPITFQYFYDDLNQLVKVVDSTGISIQYIYDPVGNILQINRSTVAPGSLTIFNVTPQTVGTGATITIQGQGFSTTASLNLVTIGGIAATVVSATSTTLVVLVPSNGMTGPISVTVGSATATSGSNETVIPTPVISSVKPHAAQAGTTVSAFVTGANLAGATFSFSLPGLTVRSSTINATGTSATLTVVAATNANGPNGVIATNSEGANSGLTVTKANAFGAFIDPTADPDQDGLPNGLELLLGTDPFNADTDGDGFSDGVEVASNSDPLDPACTPFNCRVSGEQESLLFGTVNSGPTTAAPAEIDSYPFSVLMTTSTTQQPIEADSLPFSALNNPSGSSVPFESDSLLFSVLNNPIGTTVTFEADAIPFSVCNNVLAAGACSHYTGLARPNPGGSGTLTKNRSGRGSRSLQPAFAVLAISPANKATQIAPRSTVAVAFSEPLDPASINSRNFTLSAGDEPINAALRYSLDFRTVTLNASLPPDTTIHVQVSDQVQDLLGRQLPPFQSEFQTCATCLSLSSPSVIAQRPAVGATLIGPDVPIHLSLANAIDYNLAQTALKATQDGEPIDGVVQVSQGGKAVEFVPSAPFHPGAIVKILLSANYEGLFTTRPSASDVAELSRIVRGPAMIELEYDQPLTSEAENALLTEIAASQPIPVSVIVRNSRTIRVTPRIPLPPENPPRLLSAGMDATAEIHLTFSRPIDPLTLDSDTLRLTQAGAPIAFSISLANQGGDVFITPIAALKDQTQLQLTISGVEDLSGGTLPSSTVEIHGQPGATLRAATVRERSGRRVLQFLIRFRRAGFSLQRGLKLSQPRQ